MGQRITLHSSPATSLIKFSPILLSRPNCISWDFYAACQRVALTRCSAMCRLLSLLRPPWTSPSTSSSWSSLGVSWQLEDIEALLTAQGMDGDGAPYLQKMWSDKSPIVHALTYKILHVYTVYCLLICRHWKSILWNGNRNRSIDIVFTPAKVNFSFRVSGCLLDPFEFHWSNTHLSSKNIHCTNIIL